MNVNCSSPVSGARAYSSAPQVLARAATLEGREVMYLGLYGGMMPRWQTPTAPVVVAEHRSSRRRRLQGVSAIAMHDDYWPDVSAKLRPRGLVL